MKKLLIFIIFILLIIGAALIFDQNKDMNKEGEKQVSRQSSRQVREPAVAGSFYPKNKQELSDLIEKYFSKVEPLKIEGSIKAMIVPHAGYEYSGQIAAYGYKALQSQEISRVILIGNSHKEYFDGIMISSFDAYKTPLGEVQIDNDFNEKLKAKSDKFIYQKQAEIDDHVLEVQIPFLQKVLASGWKIVPIILGNKSEQVDILINALKDLINESTLIIISSDLSHYPSYEDAQYSDNKVIQAILTGKREDLEKTISDLEKEGIDNLQTCACGQEAIEIAMGLMEGKDVKLLKYANSGDVSGDKGQVVGYASIVFTRSRLLDIAKQAVETYVKTGKIIEIKEDDVNLNKHQGAFVTLEKNGELRGCIGTFSAQGGPASGGQPLYKVVIEMAIAAATQDPRFDPVSEQELDELEYEISVLSPLQKVNSWKEIEIGKHGVEIRKGNRNGVFLPQVALENNWNLDTFMSVLCTQKAGLPADCWKDKDTEIYIFTAQVFGD